MKIFIDTADLGEISEAIDWGIADGVTTNPSLIKKAVDTLKKKVSHVDMESYIRDILAAAGRGRPVSLEVIGLTEEEIVREAVLLHEKFNGVAGNVVIKVPINPSLEAGGATSFDGLKAIDSLNAKKIPTNCTLVMSPQQALLAAKAGAMYVSPFAGRIDDMLRSRLNIAFGKADYFPPEGLYSPDFDELTVKAVEDNIPLDDNGITSGVDLVAAIVTIFQNYGFETRVLAASVRNVRQVCELAVKGAHIVTIPFSVVRDMVDHEKTVEGMKAFSADVVPEYKNIFTNE